MIVEVIKELLLAWYYYITSVRAYLIRRALCIAWDVRSISLLLRLFLFWHVHLLRMIIWVVSTLCHLLLPRSSRRICLIGPRYWTCLLHSYWTSSIVDPYYLWVGSFRLIPLHLQRNIKCNNLS